MKFSEFNERDFVIGSSLKSENILNNVSENGQKDRMQEYFCYRVLFTEYLKYEIGIKKYDDIIDESKLNFEAISKENMDFFQYFSMEDLKYFYIRNNIHMERLGSEERKFIQSVIKNQDYRLNSKSIEFIKSTYEKMIFEDVLNNGKKCIVIYGPDSEQYFAYNDALIIGFRYNEFPSNEIKSNNWNEIYAKRLIFLKNLFAKMEEEIYTKTKKEVKILQYNKFSVFNRLASTNMH